MKSMFPSEQFFNAQCQKYTPVDKGMMLSSRESTKGQILHTGISEAGSVAAMQVAVTSYKPHGELMIPFYLFYAMFGYQRTADQFGPPETSSRTVSLRARPREERRLPVKACNTPLGICRSMRPWITR